LSQTQPQEQKLTRLPRNKAELKAYFAKDPVPADLDLKEGRKEIMRMVIPAMIELVLASLAGMVDTMMVGQLGTTAIAAVGLHTQPKFILMACFIALNTGATAMVARFKGAGEHDMAQKTMHQAYFITLVLSVIMAIVGFIGSEPLMRMMGAIEGDTLEPAINYFNIQMIGFPVMALTMAATAALRGVGQTKAAMIYNMTSNVVNVFMNYCLIYGKFGFPALGVEGASIATVIGQFVAFIISTIVLMRGKFYLKLQIAKIFRFDFDIIKRILKIGTPAMIEQFIMRVGMLIYVRVVSSLGTDLYATHQICMNLLSMSFMNGQAFAVSATSLVGQSLGRKRVDHAKVYTAEIRKMGMMFSLCIGVILFVFGKPLVGLYTDVPMVIETGAVLLMIVAVMQPMQGSTFILSGALRGAGDTKSTAMITLLGMLIVRPILGYLLVYPFGLGIYGAWIALAADQLMRSVFSFYRYKLGKWQYIKV